MTSGPLFKKIFVFSLPIMAMNVLQLLFNATNMIVVGRYTGSEALAAGSRKSSKLEVAQTAW